MSDTEKAPIIEKKRPTILITTTARERTSSDASSLTLRTPKTARFTEATSVNSPITGPTKNPFADPIGSTTHLTPQPQVADIGFGYMSSDNIKHNTVEVPLSPRGPMKSALKPPGTPGRFIDPRSPTFKEEVALEKEELKTEKRNAKDLKAKKRVRVAKFFLRGVNFSCSLIVLAMLSTVFQIFNATRALPPRSNLPPWAAGQQIWPQITLLSMACVSLVVCIFVFYSYWKGGHRKAEKAAIYYTTFSIGFFLFSTAMWIVGAVVLHNSKKNGNGQDMWGWSCNQNRRSTLFQDEVDYSLLCRLQNWGFICALIEIVVEVITITIYAIVFWRIYSKRKLHKSMNVRDKARSDLYLAQLRVQSAPNTPGLKSPMSPGFGARYNKNIDEAEKGEFDDEDYEYAKRHQEFTAPKPFALQPPPALRVQEASPVVEQGEFSQSEKQAEHVPAAPGERQYDAVPIPGAYASPVASPSFAPAGMHFPEHR